MVWGAQALLLDGHGVGSWTLGNPQKEKEMDEGFKVKKKLADIIFWSCSKLNFGYV